MSPRLLATLIFALLVIPQYPANSVEYHEVLIELPDGRVFWTSGYGDVEDIVREFCEDRNLNFTNSSSGIMVDGYHLEGYHWSQGWILGTNGTIVALSQGQPLATPEHRYPRFSSSPQISYFSGGPDEVWNYSVGSGLFGSIDSSVVGYGGMMFFESWNGLYALSEDGKLLWKNKTVKGMSTPYIYNGTIFVGASDGYLYAFTYRGDFLFRFPVSRSPGYVGITSSPLVVDSTIYIAGYESDNSSARLYALSLKGDEMWNVSLNSSVYFGSPAYWNGVLYVPLAGRYNSSTSRFYPPFGIAAVRDGEVLWTFPVDGPVKSTPLVYDSSLIFTSTDGYLYRVSLDGKLMWKVHIGYSTSSPNCYDDVIYVGSGSFNSPGKLYALDLEGEALWNVSVDGGIQGSITISPPFILFSVNSEDGGIAAYDFEGKEVWNFSAGTYVLSSPGVIDRAVYFGDDSGLLHKLVDSHKPRIVFSGPQFYRYGEIIEINVSARDEVGVRSLVVNYWNCTISGKEEVNISIRADFVGSLELTATAEDYDGNVAWLNYTIYVFERELKVELLHSGEFIEGRRENLTVKVVDDQDSLVDVASVEIYVDGNLTSRGLTEDGFYHFSLSLTAGNHTMRIVATKEGYARAELVKEIHVEKKEGEKEVPQYVFHLVLISAVILAVGILFAYLMARKMRRTEDLMHEKLKNRRDGK